MHDTGYIQRVKDGVMIRDANLWDLWRAVDANAPSPDTSLALFPDPDHGFIRIVGADAILVKRIQRHARSGGHFDQL